MIAALALIAALLGGHPEPPPCSEYPQVRRMLACVERRWPVPGGIDKVYEVVDCESDFRSRLADDGIHAGLFQQNIYYWPGRWEKWGEPLGLSPDPLDPLSNAVVSLRMVHETWSWSHWSCA